MGKDKRSNRTQCLRCEQWALEGSELCDECEQNALNELTIVDEYPPSFWLNKVEGEWRDAEVTGEERILRGYDDPLDQERADAQEGGE